MIALVTGTGGKDKVTFREPTTEGASDGTSPFLDNVIMLPVADKPDSLDNGDKDVDVDTRSATIESNCGVQGNLVENCSFEANQLADRKWALLAPNLVPGWESLNNAKLEMWGDMMCKVPAPHGKVSISLLLRSRTSRVVLTCHW